MGKLLEFYTLYGKHPILPPNEAGKQYENDYKERINEDGYLCLEKVGETNVYAKIQTDLESTRIENILHAVAMGDLRALQQREAMYIDCTDMPKNLMEAQNIVLKAKQEFYELPLEVRKQFDNSPELYVSEMGTKEYIDKLAPYMQNMKKMKEEQEKANYINKVKAQAKLENDIAAERGTVEQK